MLRTLVTLVIGALLGAAGLFAFYLRPVPVPALVAHESLEDAYAAFHQAVVEAGEFVQSHQWYGTEREQAEAYRHIARAMINSMIQGVLGDPSFPYFHEIGPYTKTGMDNSDQRYLSVIVDGAGEYRVRGERGSSRRLEFSIYGEDPLSDTVASMDVSELQIAEDGSFELFVGGEARDTNWLPLKPGPNRLLVRQIFSDWAHERPGDMRIDRIDADRPPYPKLTRDDMALRIADATRIFASNVERWPEYSRTRFDALMPANVLTPPRTVGDTGGLEGRIMVGGHFYLEEDEALVIAARPTQANYQGIQLGHHWWESLDYANRQTSLTLDQARVSSDGAIYYVIAHSDPGVANWLDTEGFHRGVLMMRYDGLPSPQLTEAQEPVATRVKLADVFDHLPPDEPRIAVQARADQLAQRREAVQIRFGL